MAAELFLKPDRSRRSRSTLFQVSTQPSVLELQKVGNQKLDWPHEWDYTNQIHLLASRYYDLCAHRFTVYFAHVATSAPSHFQCSTFTRTALFASTHVEATMSLSPLWSLATHDNLSKVISYCACKLQSLKCTLFRDKCSHCDCHFECWYFYTLCN